MYGTNKRTYEMTTGLSLTTGYQTVSYPNTAQGNGSIGALWDKGGQVVLTFERSGGTDITFKVDEKFSYIDSNGNEQVSWATRTEEDSSGNLNIIERTSTETAFSYAFTTLADEIRVQIKGGDGDETANIYLTLGQIY